MLLAALAVALVPGDEGDAPCAVRMGRHDGVKSRVGPLASRSAVVQAVRMRVLAASRGIDKSIMAMFVDPGVTIGVALPDRLVGPLLWAQDGMQFRIQRVVGWRGTTPVDEVPIQVDVVLGRSEEHPSELQSLMS